ncbi:Importin-5 [Lobulomyces angularis]|nr:Importin-5 [Lobulomyces angularis]
MVECSNEQDELFQKLSMLLGRLSSSENHVRTEAEANLNKIPHHKLLEALSDIGTRHNEISLRAFAIILFRRIALRLQDKRSTIWMSSGSDTRNFCEKKLLSSLSTEENLSVRRNLCDTIADLTKYMFQNGALGTWPELLRTIFECTKSSSPNQRESAFRIISAIPALIVDEDQNVVKAVFRAALNDETLQVRAAGVKAILYYLIAAKSRNHFLDLLNDIFVFFGNILNMQEQTVTEGLTCMIELAEVYPKIFRHVFIPMTSLMSEIMSNETLEAATKHSALELLLTIIELAPSSVEKYPTLYQTLIPIVLQWIANVEDNPEWYTTNDLDDNEIEEDSIYGEQAMDRISRALGGRIVLPITFTIIPQLLGSARWQNRHAGLMAISAIAEGCQAIMAAELDKIISLVLPFYRDPHPRVRHSFCSCIGQLSTDFSPSLQNSFHSVILNNLLCLLKDSQFPKIQTHAGAALVNFTEAIDKEILIPYLDVIIETLLNFLNAGKIYMQEQALTSLSTVADRAEDGFIKYYAVVMPILIDILQQAEDKEFRLLRGKAVECSSFIALAVGKDIFFNDAVRLLTIYKQAQESIKDADDPQINFLLSAWARVCKVLGPDFSPFLDYVMKSLLRSATVKPDLRLIEAGEDTSEYPEEDDWRFLESDGKKIGIKTTVLEEKCTAINMLICYIRDMGKDFHNYADSVMQIVVPLLKFYFHDGVRFAASTCIPLLFKSITDAEYPRHTVLAVWHTVALKIIDAIMSEPDPSFTSQLFITFYESLEVLGPKSLTPALMQAFVKCTLEQLKEYSIRIKERQDSKNDADFDEDVEEQLDEEQYTDESVLIELSRTLHEIFKSEGNNFLPYIENIFSVVGQLAVNPDAASRQWAICLYCDLVEFCGPASFNYKEQFLDRVLSSLSDPVADVRQPACYALGLFAQFGGENYASVCIGHLKTLFAVINKPDSRNEENIVATENAISAIGKICCFFGNKFQIGQVLQHWLQVLPILIDEQAAAPVYEFLLTLVELKNLSILGKENANIPKLVDIFTQVLESEILEEKLNSRMVDNLRSILGCCNERLKSELWNMLPDKRK